MNRCNIVRSLLLTSFFIMQSHITQAAKLNATDAIQALSSGVSIDWKSVSSYLELAQEAERQGYRLTFPDSLLYRVLPHLTPTNYSLKRGYVTATAMSHNNSYILTGTSDGQLLFWDIHNLQANDNPLWIHPPLMYAPITSIVIDSTGNYAYAISMDELFGKNILAIYDLTDRAQPKVVSRVAMQEGAVTPKLGFTHDGNHLLIENANQTLSYWDVKDKQNPIQLGKTAQAAYRYALVSSNFKDGLALVKISDADDVLHIAFLDLSDPVTAAKLVSVPDAADTFKIALSTNGTNFVIVPREGAARLYDAASKGFSFTTIDGLTAASLTSIALSPDGKYILTGSEDGKVTLWDIANKTHTTLKGHGGKVHLVTFNPDGMYALSASNDINCRLWDLHDKTAITSHRMKGFQGPVIKAEFSSNGRYALTTSLDGTARLWDLLDPQEKQYTGALAIGFTLDLFNAKDKAAFILKHKDVLPQDVQDQIEKFLIAAPVLTVQEVLDENTLDESQLSEESTDEAILAEPDEESDLTQAAQLAAELQTTQNARIAHLETLLQSAQSLVARTEQDAKKATIDLQVAQKHIEKMQQDMQNSQKEHDAVISELQALKVQMGDLTVAQQKADQDLKRVREEREKAKKERDAAKAERNTAKAERDALKQQLAAAQAAQQQANPVVNQDLKRVKEEREKAKKERDTAKAERDAAKKERDAAITERDALKQQIAAQGVQQQAHQTLNQDLKRIREEREKAKKERDALKTYVDELAQKNETLTTEVKNLNDGVQQERKRAENLMQQLEERKLFIEWQTAQIAKLMVQVSSAAAGVIAPQAIAPQQAKIAYDDNAGVITLTVNGVSVTTEYDKPNPNFATMVGTVTDIDPLATHLQNAAQDSNTAADIAEIIIKVAKLTQDPTLKNALKELAQKAIQDKVHGDIRKKQLLDSFK